MPTNRTIEQNFVSIAKQYFKEVNQQDLAIYGATIDDGAVALVARAEVADSLLQIVNQINQQWSNQK